MGDVKSIELKIGRYKYEITEDDEFMDNQCCVQLLTQSFELANWGKRPNPILSHKAIKEIEKHEQVLLPHNYSTNVTIFKLRLT